MKYIDLNPAICYTYTEGTKVFMKSSRFCAPGVQEQITRRALFMGTFFSF